MNILKMLVLFTVCIASVAGAQAQVSKPKPKFVAYPLVLYTPEQSVIFAGSGVLVLRADETSARPDNITINAAYTLKNQKALQLIPELYSKNERTKLRTLFVYADMPTSYFGIGNTGVLTETQLKDKEEKYTNRSFVFQPQLTHTVWGDLRAGISYDFKNTDLSGFPYGKSLYSGTVPGSRGGNLSGLGAVAEYDSRDNLFYPTEGVYSQAAARFYRKNIGSDYNYNYYSADLRGYTGFSNGGVLALQFLGVVSGQETPFYDLPLYELRGVYNTYFTNRVSWYAQAEYRFHVSKNFYSVAFAGVGNTAKDVGGLTLAELQYAGGAGLRYRLDDAEKINLRFDIGVSPWGVSPYFGISEAF